MKRTIEKIWRESVWVLKCDGNKGTYSSYGRYVPANKRIVARTHHGNPCEMIRVLTREGNNYDFNFQLQNAGCY